MALHVAVGRLVRRLDLACDGAARFALSAGARVGRRARRYARRVRWRLELSTLGMQRTCLDATMIGDGLVLDATRPQSVLTTIMVYDADPPTMAPTPMPTPHPTPEVRFVSTDGYSGLF